jgi:GntR family transcriptional regulator/MocR family aminotransferase
LDTAQPLKAHELLVELDRASREPLRRQLERWLRAGIEDGSLPDGTRLPSSRGLAEHLGVSRGVVVDAYDQLTAQGFLLSRQRRAPVVCAAEVPSSAPPPPDSPYRFVLSPNAPDPGLFPRRQWLRATAEVMRELPNQELDYPSDWRGPMRVRTALAGYLTRVRRVNAGLDRLILTFGYLHSVDLICRVLAAQGARRIAMENPSIPEQAAIARSHGLAVDTIPVDEAGLVVEQLFDTEAEAVIVTPAHQFPLGMVLSAQRRRAMASWATQRQGVIVENDYDAEFRYDGSPIGAVQSLAPERTIYLGTTSKTLAPAVRLGWMVAPAEIAGTLAGIQRNHGGGFIGINAHVLAQLLLSGAYERHVQRCRRTYRRRRDALVRAIAAELPHLKVLGIAGGLHLTLRLPPACDVDSVVETVRSEGIDIRPLSHYASTPIDQPGLVLGYGRLSQSSLPGVVHALAQAVDAATPATVSPRRARH